MKLILQFWIGLMGDCEDVEGLFVEIWILLLQYVELLLVHKVIDNMLG